MYSDFLLIRKMKQGDTAAFDILGVDGATCPIQLDLWRSVYNITFLQAYLFIVFGGYIGTVVCCVMSVSSTSI